MSGTAHIAVYDTLADWEIGYLGVELRTGRFTGEPWQVVTVGPSTDPVTSMGGLRLLPDRALDRLDPAESDLLVLPGSAFWEAGSDIGRPFVDAARRFLDAGVPVAAICGATFALARAGLLDDREHTSAAVEYLQASGYRGAAHYRPERAVTDRNLTTAGPQSPVHFAAAVLGQLGLADAAVQAAYVGLFVDGDPQSYAVLQPAA